MTDDRYVARLRGRGFADDDLINLELLYCGDVGIWDRVERRFVTKSADGEWIAEPAGSGSQ